ncbi:HAD family hydrolase [Streptomyces sp. NPDC053048]|uniref:HAD family hydrolase n=1 Tax=Streptomyces sp. NPDC053048 TaxID=3365694 RepID=UPI0037D6D2D0
MHAPRGQQAAHPASTGPTPPLALFDLDGTLLDRAEGLRHWAEEFARDRGLGPGTVDWLVGADADGLKPKDQFFAEVREYFALDESPDALHDEYQQRYPSFLRCPQHVLDQLARLRAAGWRVGVVTNGLTRTQTAALEHTGLTKYLDGWVISEEAGVRKPAPRIFALAAERCGTDLTAGWFCGDSPEADAIGGQRAGLRTIWIRRGRTWPASMPPPDRIADDITQALQYLLTPAPAVRPAARAKR